MWGKWFTLQQSRLSNCRAQHCLCKCYSSACPSSYVGSFKAQVLGHLLLQAGVDAHMYPHSFLRTPIIVLVRRYYNCSFSLWPDYALHFDFPAPNRAHRTRWKSSTNAGWGHNWINRILEEITLGTIVGRIMAPKGITILIPVTGSNVWYMAKWNEGCWSLTLRQRESWSV